MRPIKFQAWDTIDKRMVTVQAITFHHLEGTPHTIKVEGKEWNIEPRFKLREFTGARDENGEEIWEGDIVLRHKPHAVVFCNESVAFLVERRKPDGSLECQEYFDNFEYEKIGNVYENPELLEK